MALYGVTCTHFYPIKADTGYRIQSADSVVHDAWPEVCLFSASNSVLFFAIEFVMARCKMSLVPGGFLSRYEEGP